MTTSTTVSDKAAVSIDQWIDADKKQPDNKNIVLVKIVVAHATNFLLGYWNHEEKKFDCTSFEGELTIQVDHELQFAKIYWLNPINIR
jgi:hypothetical protein